MKPYLPIIISTLICGCSTVQPDKQDLKIGTLPDARIYVNDRYVGNGSVQVKVPRDSSVFIKTTKPGYQDEIRFIQSTDSIWGKLDTAGVYFLFPSVGLFTPGSKALEKDDIFIDMHLDISN